jgi:hypothetical protein
VSRIEPTQSSSLDSVGRASAVASAMPSHETAAPTPSELRFVTERASRDEYLLASIGLEEALFRLGVADLVARLESGMSESKHTVE